MAEEVHAIFAVCQPLKGDRPERTPSPGRSPLEHRCLASEPGPIILIQPSPPALSTQSAPAIRTLRLWCSRPSRVPSPTRSPGTTACTQSRFLAETSSTSFVATQDERPLLGFFAHSADDGGSSHPVSCSGIRRCSQRRDLRIEASFVSTVKRGPAHAPPGVLTSEWLQIQRFAPP